MPREVIVDPIKAMHERRSVRAYQTRPVPRELLEELLWAAVQAPIPPVSGNDPWAIMVFQGVEPLERYGVRARDYAFEHQPAGRSWEWTTRPGFRVFWGAPALVLFCAKASNPEAPFDCCRAAQNFVIAAHARGLGSCWVGAPIPWLSDPGVRSELGVPEGFIPSAAIVLGYPAEQPVGNPKPKPNVLWASASDV
jgi:nitroreductase